MKIRTICFAALMMFVVHAEDLIVQADPWCPYNCEMGSEQPGYIIEMLQSIYAVHGIRVVYQTVPWTRAISNAREGLASAVIAISAEEAQRTGLLVGHETVGVAVDCLFVNRDNRLDFRMASDMDSLDRLGIVAGYAYSGEFNVWLETPSNKHKVFIQHGDHPADLNLRHLVTGRLDGMIENEVVMTHLIKQHHDEMRIRNAGCDQSLASYIGFSPELVDVQQRIRILDDGIAAMRKSGRLSVLLEKYGVADWVQARR